MKQNKSAFIFLVKTILFSLFFIGFIVGLYTLFSYMEETHSDHVPAFSFDQFTEENKTVILDAGHGGMDSGALTPWGDEEKHINLSVTKKLGAFLEEAGIRVIYTRTEDEMLTCDQTSSRKAGDLLARVKLAKEYPNATFISIHMNTLPIEKYNGLQVFYSRNHSLSKVLALQIQNDTKTLLQPDNHREVKNAKGDIYLLDRISSPAVLVECGFLSNHEEARLLLQEEYQEKLAFVISRSVISFVLHEENFE